MYTKEIAYAGAWVYFILVHVAMFTYYKRYRYFGMYMCELERRVPENRKSVVLYKVADVVFLTTFSALMLTIGDYLGDYENVGWFFPWWAVLVVSGFFMIVYSVYQNEKIHVIGSLVYLSALTGILIIIGDARSLAVTQVYLWSLAVLFSAVFVSFFLKGKYTGKTVRSVAQKFFLGFLYYTVFASIYAL